MSAARKRSEYAQEGQSETLFSSPHNSDRTGIVADDNGEYVQIVMILNNTTFSDGSAPVRTSGHHGGEIHCLLNCARACANQTTLLHP